MPKGSCDPVLEQAPGMTCGSMERQEPMLEQVCWQELWPVPWGTHTGNLFWRGLHPVAMTHAGAGAEELHLMGMLPQENFMEDCLLSEANHAGDGEQCGVLSPWGVSTDHSLWSPFWGKEEVKIIKLKLSPGRREVWKEVSLRFVFTSHYTTLIWLVMDLGNFPNSSLFCLWQYLLSNILLSLSWPMSFTLYFLSSVPMKRGVIEQFLWAPGVQTVSHHTLPLFWFGSA